MKALCPLPFLCLLLTSSLLQTSAWSQAAFDPSRATQAIRPDVSAPLLIDRSSDPRGLADENGFAIPTPGDSDIGQQLILKRQEIVQPFYALLDSSEYFTTNAADAHSGANHDWFFAGGATVGWQPRLTDRLYFDSWVAQHWFRYNRFSGLDYEDGEAAVGLIVVMPELWNTLWHVHYYYERVTQGLDNSPLYQTHTIRAGTQKTVLLDRLNSLNFSLLAALSAEASPRQLQRHEYSLYSAWNFKITRELFFTASYRLGYYNYLHFNDREDWYHNFGVALSYRPKEWLEGALSWNYTLNRSNLEVFSYDSQLAGPSISLKAKF